jgi:gliding motility-associated lipoprotein GldH
MNGQRALYTDGGRWSGTTVKAVVPAIFHGVIALLLLSGCTTDTLYQRIDPLEGRGWDTAQALKHEVVVVDTLRAFDFYLNLRIGEDYPFSNIYLFVNTTFPNGSTARDTVECILADPTGRWLGTGLGDIRDNKIMFKPKVRFPHAGTYVFELEQGMRVNPLPDVFDVGISIHTNKGN